MKNKIVNFLKFGYISENIIAYGVFFITVILYFFNRWSNVDMGINLADIQNTSLYIIVFYFRYAKDILVILLIKLVLEYFVQNQRLLKKIATSNNVDYNNTENTSEN